MGKLPLGLVAGCLLLAAALALLASGLRDAASFDPRPDLVDFYPPERNAAGEYRFAYPDAALFWAEPLAPGARLTLRAQSPPPLPERELALTTGAGELLRVPVGAEPRTLRVLLPPGDAALAGFAVGLASAGAEVEGDVRRLGLLFSELRLDVPPRALPLGRYALAAVLIVLTVGLALSLGLGWAAAGALAVALALLFRADAARLWPVGGGLCAALAAARLLLPRPVMDWAERQRPWSAPAWAAAGVGAAFVAVIGGRALQNHALYGTNGYDLGLYDQTLWLISRALPSYSTGAGINMVGSHAALALYPLAPLYWLLPDARVLLAAQTLAVSLAVVPLYLVAHERGRPWLGVAAGAAYLAHPATQNMALFDFHIDTLAATALLFALWAVEARRWRLLLVCCALVLLCKENFALTVAWLGVGLIVLRRQWRVGAALVGVSAVWFLVATQLLVPSLVGQDESLHMSRFARYGDSLPAIALFALRNPHVVLGDMLAPGWMGYLIALLAPLALLPLLSPYVLLALPALAINLLSAFEGQRGLFFHYNSLVVAIFVFAALDGAGRVMGWAGARSGATTARRVVQLGLVTLLLGGAWLGQGVTELRREMIAWAAVRDEALGHRRAYALSLVAPGAPVSAQSNLQPHLSTRRQAFIFPNPFLAADFYNPEAMPFTPLVDQIVVDRRRLAGGAVPVEAQLALLDELERRGLYRRAADLGGLVLLERVPGAPESCYGPGWEAEACRQ